MPNISNLASLDIATQYRTGELDPLSQLYRPCLAVATEYKRAVGYFRSSVYLIVGSDTVEFARRGGKIRLVCSPSISAEDASSIAAGYTERATYLADSLSAQIDHLLADATTSYRTRVLATLVAASALDIRLALRPEAYGLYHEKIGLFLDYEGSRVSFLGSSNETWNGWHFLGNHEAVEVFRSWSGEAEADRVEKHDAYFERLWAGTVGGVETVAFPDAAKRKLVSASLGDAGDIDISMLHDQHLGDKRTPLPHQVCAVDAWEASGRRGILEHATGSGKTFTAITAMRSHLDSGQTVLIVVPSKLLLEQWAAEIRLELPDAVLLLAGSGNDKWKAPGRLLAMTHPSPDHGPRIILATMQTAASGEFLKSVWGGKHLMLIGDEVHQTGSTYNSKLYTLESGPRLGLSATPTRYGDPDGTARMFGYFGPLLPPPVTLQDAIDRKSVV